MKEQQSIKSSVSVILFIFVLFLCFDFSQVFAAVSPDKSTMTVAPGIAEADGSNLVKLTVTLRDGSNVAVSGETVSLDQGAGSSTITTTNDTSNANGQVNFTLTNTNAESVTYVAKSTNAGGAALSLKQKAIVKFTKPTSAEAKKAGAANSTLNIVRKDLRDKAINNLGLLSGSSNNFNASDGRDILDKPGFESAMDELVLNDKCLRDVKNVSTTWDWGNRWSLGPAVTAQLLRYDTKTGKAALNAMGLGAGLSARYYSADNLDPAALVMNAKGDEVFRSILRIHPDCRLSTFQFNETRRAEGKLYARSVVSLGLFAFVSKEADKDVLHVDPAFTVGFLQDLLTLGVGVSTQGRSRGHAFLLLGLGSAFDL